MGIVVVVEDERGKTVASLADSTNILHSLLPAQDDISFRCLNRVDWHGNTTFNRHQVRDVHQELKRLATGGRSVEELRLIRKIEALAMQCEAEPHLYLKFYGD
jgi:hypothetical protein